MWAGQIFLGILGMSAGVVVAGGLFSFIVDAHGNEPSHHVIYLFNKVVQTASCFMRMRFQPGQSLEMSFRSFGLEFPDSPCCWHFSDYLPGFLSAAGRWHLQRS